MKWMQQSSIDDVVEQATAPLSLRKKGLTADEFEPTRRR